MYLETRQVLRPERIKVAVDIVGADRVIFGTGAPHLNPRQCMETVKLANLTEKDEELVLGGTLAKQYRM